MIIDSLENAERYESIHPLFAEAFRYIKSIDLKNAEIGKTDLNEGLKIIVAEKEGMTTEESTAKFECHNQNIDIQLCISGKETMGWKSRQSCKSPRGEYNSEKDVLFYDDAPDMYFELTDNQFAIFFPEDVHAPMIGDDVIKKLIVKVRV
jgi:YhcH/YjgK/YiaL family protein